MNESFNPERFALARKRRGMKKRELATQIGVTERSVSSYESGKQKPEKTTLAKIASVLQFPEAFFLGDKVDMPSSKQANFRSISKLSASLRNSALGAGAIALLVDEYLESLFDLPAINVPDLGADTLTLPASDIGPEVAASMLRQDWGLAETPIKNMIHLLESKGIRVFSLAIDSKDVDAFSMWHMGKPYIFLNTFKSAERCRFDAAHELGHLVMHKHLDVTMRDLEREANAFASAFLMPKEACTCRAPQFVDLDSLISYKKYWGVSVAALNYRLHHLGLTTEWVYRTLCIQISERGYRVHEPEPMHREQSAVLEKVFKALKGIGMSRSDVAEKVCITLDELNQLTFGLILNVMSGSGSKSNSNNLKNKANLRLVEV